MVPYPKMGILGSDTSKEGLQVQEWTWFPRSQGVILSLRTFFSDAHLIGQLANWIIDQTFEIELGFGDCSDWHETRRNEVFRLIFAKMGSREPIFDRKRWNKNGVF